MALQPELVVCMKCGGLYSPVHYLHCPKCFMKSVMNTKQPEQVPMANGIAASTKGPPLHLIPTVALEVLAERFQLGIERKGDKAWNAISDNQECLKNKEFLIERCSHIIHHALKLRDQLVSGENEGDSMAGNAAAIAWGGVFLICAAVDLSKVD